MMALQQKKQRISFSVNSTPPQIGRFHNYLKETSPLYGAVLSLRFDISFYNIL